MMIRDAKFTCDVKSSNNDNQEIGLARHPTAPFNPHITKVDSSVFYHPNDQTCLNFCNLGEFHINTQTEPASFTSKQLRQLQLHLSLKITYSIKLYFCALY